MDQKRHFEPKTAILAKKWLDSFARTCKQLSSQVPLMFSQVPLMLTSRPAFSLDQKNLSEINKNAFLGSTY